MFSIAPRSSEIVTFHKDGPGLGNPDWTDSGELAGLQIHLCPFVGMRPLNGVSGILDTHAESGSVQIDTSSHCNCGISHGYLFRLERTPEMAGFGWQLVTLRVCSRYTHINYSCPCRFSALFHGHGWFCMEVDLYKYGMNKFFGLSAICRCKKYL